LNRQAGEVSKGEKTECRIPSDAVVFPIAKTGECFSRQPVALADFQTACPPLTGRFADGRVFSIMEAHAVNYPRFQLKKNPSGAVGVAIRETSLAPSGEPFSTPWRMMRLAENEAKLVEQEYVVYNFNPPCTADTSWIVPGKTISNAGNCEIRTADLTSIVDFAAENNIKYLQIDWGWYGTEWTYSDAECEQWAKNNPGLAADPTWRANTKPDPYKVASGVVPYFPTFMGRCRSTFVDVDIEKLVAYGKAKGVGICLYLNDRMIKKHDIDDLFAHYEKWGLAGLKPGFVAYGGANHTDQLRHLNETAAKHNLWLDIHDAYLPDGSSRTFPGLMNVEGGGGQEHNYPAYHDVTLPFTRGLAGPYDYTPLFFCRNKSNAHQLSLLMTIYAPAPVIRGAWSIRDNKEGNAFGPEIEFFRRVETSWMETKVLDAEIGKHITTVRKTANGEWYLGATNGADAYTSKIALGFLDAGKVYELKLWTDAPEANGEWRSTVQTVKSVRNTDIVELPMAAAGGAVGIFSVKPEPQGKP
jgi:alpha-glucosidase